MSWTIGQHEKGDGDARIRKAYEWYSQLPPFLFSICTMFCPTDLDLFVDEVEKGINFYAERDGELMGLVHAEIKRPGIVEGHLFAAPTADLEILAAAISYARVEVLKEYEVIISLVHRRHRTLHRVMNLSGFVDSGLRAWHGVYRGRLQEIRYYLATRS